MGGEGNVETGSHWWEVVTGGYHKKAGVVIWDVGCPETLETLTQNIENGTPSLAGPDELPSRGLFIKPLTRPNYQRNRSFVWFSLSFCPVAYARRYDKLCCCVASFVFSRRWLAHVTLKYSAHACGYFHALQRRRALHRLQIKTRAWKESLRSLFWPIAAVSCKFKNFSTIIVKSRSVQRYSTQVVELKMHRNDPAMSNKWSWKLRSLSFRHRVLCLFVDGWSRKKGLARKQDGSERLECNCRLRKWPRFWSASALNIFFLRFLAEK